MKVYQLARLYRTAACCCAPASRRCARSTWCSDLLAAHLRPQLVAREEPDRAGPADVGRARRRRPRHAGRRPHDGGRRAQRRHGPACSAQIARFHDDEVARFIDWFTRAFEPVLMAVLGVADRRRGGADVHADLRACREHPMMITRRTSPSSPTTLRMRRDRPLARAAATAAGPAFDADPLRRGHAPRLRRAARRRRRAVGGARRPVRPRHPGLDRGAAARAVPLPPGAAARTSRPTSSQQEAGLRAMDGVAEGLHVDRRRARHAQEISFEAASRSRQHRGAPGELDALRRAEGRRERRAPRVDRAPASPSSTASTACSPRAETMPGTELAEQVISRIKVMSELDIAERRVPQDGRFKARRDGREIDFRVSVMPSVFGEDAVLRILDRQRALRPAAGPDARRRWASTPDMKQRLRQLSTEPYGMLLVTGPTGSGKTTTLYAVISEANKGLDKIITIEDPVEYQLPGRAADPGERAEGPHLRARPALDPAPRPGPHHGGRDPRPGDRRDRGAVGAHRPPRLHHGAREQRDRRARPLPAHGRGRLQPGVGAERRAGAAPGAGASARPVTAKAAATAAAPASRAARRSASCWC